MEIMDMSWKVGEHFRWMENYTLDDEFQCQVKSIIKYDKLPSGKLT
jgi:hypothetical protein